MTRPCRLIAATAFLCCSAGSPILAASAGAPQEAAGLHVDGALLGPAWVVPFAGMLLSIALFPLLAPAFWHRHFGKVAAFWALLFLVPFTAGFGWRPALYELLHVALGEYLPFIILLTALFTVAGGVRVVGHLRGTPGVNIGLLVIGTGLASLMGTTGAAMLLIRPLLRANQHRRYRVHTVVFFIFLVANIGGALSPLGDPPLFLGFLQGVPFFWPTLHLLVPCVLASGLLLGLYAALDLVLFAREGRPRPGPGEGEPARIALEGGVNLVLLFAVVATVLLSGVWNPGVTLVIYHVPLMLQDLLRDLLLVVIAVLSWRLTSRQSRLHNGFSWFPMLEVAKLFAGIFITIVPAIAILRAGPAGAFSGLIDLVSRDGQPVDAAYFWMTGLLSSFLDNAPTYLVFFNMAGGDTARLIGPLAGTLAAISAGAVFMGANTYVGNAPNFMVRAIAEERGVAMPSFFGYMAWSLGILLPVFLLVTLLFFR